MPQKPIKEVQENPEPIKAKVPPKPIKKKAPQKSTKAKVSSKATRPKDSVCLCSRMSGRNLVVNLDGTGNQFGERNTNVIEFYNLIGKEESDNQLCWYNSGIGTYARPSWTSFEYFKKVLFHEIDLAIAWEFERTVLGAYRWLSDNYQEGDCIFLFGFSRGAFQVRVLSAMIEKVGLIHKGNEMQIPFAYELYADPKSGDQIVKDVESSEDTTMAARFKRAFCHRNVKVHFVGAWDTVSSIGVMRGQHMLPGTVDGMKHVCYFRHALALDERRVKFLPEYACGGSNIPLVRPHLPCANITLAPPWLSSLLHDNLVFFCISEIINFIDQSFPISHRTGTICFLADLLILNVIYVLLQLLYVLWKHSLVVCTHDISTKQLHDSAFGSKLPPSEAEIVSSKEKKPHTLEVWFAGTHSDIGGGNVQNEGMNRSRPPLRWMVLEAFSAGLRIESKFKNDLTSEEQIEVKESLTWAWKALEWLPFKRLTFAGADHCQQETYMPHFGAGRVIQPGQKLHHSLILSGSLGGSYVPKARLSDPRIDRLEFWQKLSKSEGLSHLVEMDRDIHIEQIIRIFVLEETQRQNMMNILEEITMTWNSGRQDVYDITMKAWGKKTFGKIKLQNQHNEIIKQLMSQLDMKEQIRKNVEDAFYDFIFKSKRVEPVSDILKRFVTWGYGRQAIHEVLASVVKTGTLCTESLPIKSQLQLINLTQKLDVLHTGKTDALQDRLLHKDGLISTEEPPILENELRTQVEKALHRFFFSDDKSEEAMNILQEHAYKAVGRQIVYDVGIDALKKGNILEKIITPDHRFKIAEVITEVLGQHHGVRLAQLEDVRHFLPTAQLRHDRDLAFKLKVRRCFIKYFTSSCTIMMGGNTRHNCVAFSPDSTKLVSGSQDNTVRIWNVATGLQIGKPLTGHKSVAKCVAFSPRGKFIVSSSDDGTIRRWDTQRRTQMGDPWELDGYRVDCIAFSPNRKRVMSGSSDKCLRVWNYETGKQTGSSFKGHQKVVWSVACSPDGRLAASGSGDGTMRIWDVATKKQVGATTPNPDSIAQIFTVSFSPDGKFVAYGANNGKIYLWDVDKNQHLGEPLAGHKGSVLCVYFAPDGKMLASASKDRTVRLWDVKSGTQIGKPLAGHSHVVNYIAISPDGTKIASASSDKTIRIWDIKYYLVQSQKFEVRLTTTTVAATSN